MADRGNMKNSSDVKALSSLHHLRGPTMGTDWHVLCAADIVPEPSLGQGLQAAVDMVDYQMSTWKPESEVSRFNATPPGDWTPVAPELAFVVGKALEVGRLSGGAFDITLGRQVSAAGFGPDGVPVKKSDATPSFGLAALEVQLDPPSLRKTANLSIDLSGIAKGYGVDCLAAHLDRAGIGNYLVTLDGELRCKGRKPGADSVWMIGLDAPVPGEHRFWDVLTPMAGALATSGDYRHFHVIDGRVLAHTIDPKTGKPLENGVASVTVHRPTCWQADAWATALMVMGPQKGVAVAQAREIPALFLLRGQEGLREVATGDFDRLCRDEGGC